MTTTDATTEHLLRAIADNPEDDTVRLAYADWLDEQGDVDVPCPKCEGKKGTRVIPKGRPGGLATQWQKCSVCSVSGTIRESAVDPGRAELIRVQVEQEAYDRRDVKSLYISDMDRMRYLRERKKALLDTHAARWLAAPCPWCAGIGFGGAGQGGHTSGARCATCGGSGDLLKASARDDPDRRGHRRHTFTRGFLDSVTVPRLVDVVREGLPYRIDPDGWEESKGAVVGWLPTPWASAVVAAFPTLTRIVAEDRKPDYDEGGYEWYDLPDPLSTPRTEQTFATSSGAVDALAVELCQFVKGKRP